MKVTGYSYKINSKKAFMHIIMWKIYNTKNAPDTRIDTKFVYFYKLL